MRIVKLLNLLVMKRIGMAMLIALCAIAFAGCKDKVSDEAQKTQDNTEQTGSQTALYRGVSAAEYSKSDVDMRRLIDLVDGAANALLAMQQNGANRGFEAEVIFSTKEKGIFANTVVISRPSREEQDNAETSEEQPETCKVCGFMDGLDCYKKIKKKMEQDNKDEMDIHLKLEDGCVVLIY